MDSLPQRYADARPLGEGSFGTVYAADDTLLHRPVAVKVLRDATARQRFAREVQLTALLGTHPHVVTAYDAGEWQGRPFLVLELLGARVRGDVPEHVALRWLAQTAAALDFVHGHGIVHRDVKPANLLLDEHGDVRLTDFGVARGGTLTELTDAGAAVGTPGYLAPEVAAGGIATAASDVYSFAVVARELLGDRPELAAALSADPTQRPVSARAIVAALGAGEEPTGILQPRPNRVAAIPRTRIATPIGGRRHGRAVRRGASIAAVAVVAAAAAAGGAFVAGRASATRTPRTAPAQRQQTQTCTLSPFHHNTNVVVTSGGALAFCRAQAHALALEGDRWSYRAGAELFTPDTGSTPLTTVCTLVRGRARIRIYDSGARAIGSDVCSWYATGGWRRA